MEKLAEKIEKIMFEYDFYDYRDAVDSREEGLEYVKTCLKHNKTAIIEYLNELINDGIKENYIKELVKEIKSLN